MSRFLLLDISPSDTKVHTLVVQRKEHYRNLSLLEMNASASQLFAKYQK